MSYISEYRLGYISEEEYDLCAAEENRRDRYEREHEYDEYEEGEEDEGLDTED